MQEFVTYEVLGKVPGLPFWNRIWKEGGSIEIKTSMKIIQGLDKCHTTREIEGVPSVPIFQKEKKKEDGAMTQLLGHLHRDKISGSKGLLNLVEKARHKVKAGS